MHVRAVARRSRPDRHRQLPGRLLEGQAVLGWEPHDRVRRRDRGAPSPSTASTRGPRRRPEPAPSPLHVDAFLAAVAAGARLGHRAARAESSTALRARAGDCLLGAPPRRGGVAAGAAALQLALAALGVGPGDEVIVPAFTAVPTASAVCAVGAVPVPVDVDADTAAIDPTPSAAALTGRTRAIVPCTSTAGRRRRAARELGVPVVEDAAQAHGALAGRHRRGRGLPLLPDQERRRHRRRRRRRRPTTPSSREPCAACASTA